jgi:hypothetical protein
MITLTPNTKGAIMASQTRTSEQGHTYDVATIRSFLLTILTEEPVYDRVNELLLEHVEAGRYHPSVVIESMRGRVAEVLQTATYEDWEHVGRRLIADARETLLEDTPARA